MLDADWSTCLCRELEYPFYLLWWSFFCQILSFLWFKCWCVLYDTGTIRRSLALVPGVGEIGSWFIFLNVRGEKIDRGGSGVDGFQAKVLVEGLLVSNLDVCV